MYFTPYIRRNKIYNREVKLILEYNPYKIYNVIL